MWSCKFVVDQPKNYFGLSVNPNSYNITNGESITLGTIFWTFVTLKVIGDKRIWIWSCNNLLLDIVVIVSDSNINFPIHLDDLHIEGEEILVLNILQKWECIRVVDHIRHQLSAIEGVSRWKLFLVLAILIQREQTILIFLQMKNNF